jgi:toxin ParE1/3/4
MPTLHQHEAARRDLVEHFVHLAENAGVDTAERFLRHAESAFDDLARQPGIGSPLRLRHPDLAGLRKWRIHGFDNHLVFYLPDADGVSIVRVLHATRNWWSLLGFEA